MKVDAWMGRTLLAFLATLGMSAASGQGLEQSGFLGSYGQLRPDPVQEGALVYRHPDFDRTRITGVILAPVEVWVAPDSSYQGINPDQLKRLTDGFRRVMVESLEPDTPVVTEPGPGIVAVRIAITRVHLREQQDNRGLFTYAPRFTGGGADAAQGPQVRLSKAVFEAELRDSQSGEILAQRVESQPHSPTAAAGEDWTWADVDEMLRYRAKRFSGMIRTPSP